MFNFGLLSATWYESRDLSLAGIWELEFPGGVIRYYRSGRFASS